MSKSGNNLGNLDLVSRIFSAFLILSGLFFACLFTIFGEKLHAAAGDGFCIVACVCLAGGTIALIKLNNSKPKSDKEIDMLRGIPWISVDDRMPKASSTDNLLLVLVADSTVPALAIFTGRRWKVQPLFTKWFVTRDGVTHWRKVSNLAKKRRARERC